ncbi:NADH-quinone oxidoreductase subunit I [Anaerolineales bacterium]|nr:NADH-quinone oxidoreductase subunit I [Anaerolineales bacterium]
MYGLGILKGLSVTWKRFWDTYIDDISWAVTGKKRYRTEEGIKHRSSKNTKGIFTVQYPEEQLIVPEEFRFVPFLVYEEKDGKKDVRCTACGICAKACPPQCIWIVRSSDPVTGKPVATPSEFYIDMDVCMNCGFCAEYCPFDAIKMDHDFDIASFGRNVYNLEKLLKPVSYYSQIRPLNYNAEEEERRAKEAAKAARAAGAAITPAA